MDVSIWGGFLIGFLGSFHCVGMCGPIALALPIGKGSNLQLVVSRILYNLGRIVTYTFFGAVFGLFGKGIAFAGLQRYASITLGVAILLYYLLPGRFKGKLSVTKPYLLASNFVKKSFTRLTKTGSAQSLFLFGIVNGFLPCGFVYVALAGALTTGDFLSGAAFMALFGLGTAPIMFATSLVGKFISDGIRSKINKLIPVFAIILAIIFILRGLSLGIPFLSPPEKKLNVPITLETAEDNCCSGSTI
ncbi:MAG: sulfite exporter TauE/SafE family protein [Melioribacteraceae bacterium]|nr:sulfite exporter TauE/SafE family protein [Melioribacteraceae bacterium]